MLSASTPAQKDFFLESLPYCMHREGEFAPCGHPERNTDAMSGPGVVSDAPDLQTLSHKFQVSQVFPPSLTLIWVGRKKKIGFDFDLDLDLDLDLLGLGLVC